MALVAIFCAKSKMQNAKCTIDNRAIIKYNLQRLYRHSLATFYNFLRVNVYGYFAS
jgi:hypothetical protein